METGNNHIDDYMSWLEVALRAQVVCNKAFFKKYNEIEVYVHTQAQGLLESKGADDALHELLDKLKQMLTAVANKYDISDSFLKRYYNTK